MEVTSTVFFFMLWIPVYTRSPTDSPSLGISCKECSEGFNRTHNWQCRFGCGHFYQRPRSHRRRPHSITRPTPTPTGQTGSTRAGSYLPCEKCFGHGHAKHPDPRCKYGCGRWMTYPKTEIRPATITDEPVTSAIKVGESTADDHQASPSIIEATPETLKKTNSFKTTFLRYKNSIVIIGLFAGLVAMLVGYVLYSVHQRRKTGAEPTAGDAPVIMSNLYNNF